MLVCPSCHSEFRSGFERCSTCDVDLVPPEALDDAKIGAGLVSPHELLADVDKAVIGQPNLAAARELERVLLEADIPCYAHAAEADQDVALGSSAALMYGVVLAADQVERAREVFHQRFASMLEADGLGAFTTEAVDVEADEVTCPACGHQGPLADGECGDCGLFLGAPS